MAAKYPAEPVQWREVTSEKVAAIGWDRGLRLYARFRSGEIYFYEGVRRQRAVACSRAKSVGSYLARKIAPNSHAVKVT